MSLARLVIIDVSVERRSRNAVARAGVVQKLVHRYERDARLPLSRGRGVTTPSATLPRQQRAW
jgi:hypothetical protein